VENKTRYTILRIYGRIGRMNKRKGEGINEK